MTTTILPRDPNVVEPGEARRLSRQSAAILAMLERGPVTNKEMSALALKYTSRISDLRAVGYVIEVTSRDRDSGEVTYELKGAPPKIA